MAVYDVFTFYDEFELLLVRLREHASFVDHFILIQGDSNFTGKPKPFHFPNSDARFAPYLSKIQVKNIQLDQNPASPWENELKQRNESLNIPGLEPSDVIYLSDVDEIISRNYWPYLLSRIKTEELLRVWTEPFYYRINLQLPKVKWVHPKILRAEYILEKKLTANEVRHDSTAPTTPFPCGWHFSFLMTEKKIEEKIHAFSHQECNLPQFNNPVAIREAIRRRRFLFEPSLKFRSVPVKSSWPLQMLEGDYWKDFICPLQQESLTPREHLENFRVDLSFWLKKTNREARAFVAKAVKLSIKLLTNFMYPKSLHDS